MHKSFYIHKQKISAAFLGISLLIFLSSGIAHGDDAYDFSDVPLESLFLTEIQEIHSVSRKRQPSFKAPAASFVLHSEDIIASGYTEVPEILRLIPGIYVARANANTWNVTTRGLGDTYLNHLLVMIDGRSVFNPSTSSVDWDVRSPALHDIERIEVVRGPGSVLWGLNAVNGIVNIVTKNSQKTVGSIASFGLGNEQEFIGEVQQGFQINPNESLRLSAYYRERDALTRLGDSVRDEWNSARAAFRYDNNCERDVFTLQGDVAWTESRVGGPLTYSRVGERVDGVVASLRSQWSYDFSQAAQLNIQFFYEHFERKGLRDADQRRDTFDLEITQRIEFSDVHDVVVGAGARFFKDRIDDFGLISFDPKVEDIWSVNIFVQDEIRLIPDFLKLTLGTKFTHNDYIGEVLQPGIRLGVTPSKDLFLWSSVTRAVRVPARFERQGAIGVEAGENVEDVFFQFRGSDSSESEDVIAYEMGLRRQHDLLSWDLSLFYNDYSDVSVTTPGTSFAGVVNDQPATVFPLFVDIGKSFSSYGAEASLSLDLSAYGRVRASYSYLQVDQDDLSTLDVLAVEAPGHMATLFHTLQIVPGLTSATTVRYAEAIFNTEGSPSDLILNLDAALHYKVKKGLTFSLIGQNLFTETVREYSGVLFNIPGPEVERSFLCRMTWSLDGDL